MLIGRRRFKVSLRQEVLEAYSPTTKVAGSSTNRPNQKNRGSIEAVVQVRTNIAATVVVHVRVMISGRPGCGYTLPNWLHL